MSINQRLSVFVTGTHPCSYIEGKVARTAFLDPSIEITAQLASSLNHRGFRRSGRYLYRTSCPACSACQPLRVEVGAFKPNRSQKRNWARNSNLNVRTRTRTDVTPVHRQSYFELYGKYISHRHPQGDMHPPDRNQFDGFIGELYGFSHIMEFSDGDRLVMVSLSDRLHDGYSAIYTFYDPDLQARGPGVFSVLWQIQECRRLDLDYLYLGFWIEDCSKMSYKSAYKPNEILHSDHWQPGPGSFS